MLTPPRTTHALVAIILLAALTLAPQADVRAVAVTRYVSSVGEDSTNCSDSAAPCLTINYAIGQAVAGDTIEVAVGTYTAASGAEVVLVSKNLTLSGGWDADFIAQGDLSTIDGGNTRRGLRVGSGVTATVDHFVVQNGFNSSLGGGIYNDHATLTLANSRVIHNVSEWMGGGIDNYGTLTINDSVISDNTAGKETYSGGGGGGGIESYNGTVTVNNTTISGNQIVGAFQGGAIDMKGTVILNNSTVSGNSGATAIYSLSGTLTINNTTVSGNSAPSGTGGLIILGGSLSLSNSTVTANTTPNGTGGIVNAPGYSGSVTLRNSIVAGNTGTSGSKRDCYGAISSAGYNLLGTDYGCTFTAATGDLVGTTSAPIDPKLGALRDNGGPTYTHALAGNSPALNAGNPAIPGSGGDACLATDQRGFDRVAEGDCDIGAYEGHFPAVSGVTRTDPNPTGASSVHFAVAFSDPVSGVDTTAPFNDFSLITGLTGAAITAVGGSESAYIVTVNTGTGDGTLRLNVIDNDSIVNGDGEPLGGSGTGNGDYTSGQVYTVDKTPSAKSVVRATSSPTSAAQVKFNVTFSTPVTGINKTAPFSDFKLTTTGVTAAAVSGVSGSGTSYTVLVKTGSGNGTIRLDVQDDDTIKDSWGNPLGGTGTGNGKFTSGQTYTIKKIPSLTSPKGTLWDRTPTYTWSKIPAATQYQYQLAKDTITIYTKGILSSACGTACSATPLPVLNPANYRWRARALASGIWQAWSPYLSFKLVAPKAGFWKAAYVEFYVAPDRSQVDDFTSYISVYGCGTYKITYFPLVAISNGEFSFSSSGYYATGAFSATYPDAISAKGTVGLNSFYIPGCGFITGGPLSWSATWQNSSQPADAAGMTIGPIVVAPAPAEGEGLPFQAESQ